MLIRDGVILTNLPRGVDLTPQSELPLSRCKVWPIIQAKIHLGVGAAICEGSVGDLALNVLLGQQLLRCLEDANLRPYL